MTPRFAPGFKFRHDAVRDEWVVLGPERAFVPDAVGAEVLKLIDGKRTVDEVVEALARVFDAPPAVINADVIVLIDDLVERGVLKS